MVYTGYLCSSLPHVIFLRQNPSLSLELTDSAWLAIKPQGICLLHLPVLRLQAVTTVLAFKYEFWALDSGHPAGMVHMLLTEPSARDPSDLSKDQHWHSFRMGPGVEG